MSDTAAYSGVCSRGHQVTGELSGPVLPIEFTMTCPYCVEMYTDPFLPSRVTLAKVKA